MTETLAQLRQLFIGAIPTILIFGILHLYLKAVLYAPLRRILAERASRIEGKFELARRDTESAEAKLKHYQDSIRQAQAEGYRAVEARRRQALEAGRQHMEEARHRAEQVLLKARQQLAADSAHAQESLRGAAEGLAVQITGHVLGQASQGANAL